MRTRGSLMYRKREEIGVCRPLVPLRRAGGTHLASIWTNNEPDVRAGRSWCVCGHEVR
ncbi:hypothetical protein [Evansella halocellulosilytica]|uniref:hypothetical protein n=1 Tax=Evansella halocellulosilytica TaxID=2011013 RepID=UPI0015C816B4|nr:hypothetical protein [Evansella halocellulosilytica]